MPTLLRNVPATEFYRFLDLPAELRLVIWNMILNMRPGPGVVYIELKEGGKSGKFTLVAKRPQPVLFYVSRESRASTGLSKLNLTNCRKPHTPIDMPKHPIYVNLQEDTFHMAPLAIHCLRLKDLAQIRIAEVPCIIYAYPWRQSFASNKRSFFSCTALERLTLTIHERSLGDATVTSEEPNWSEQLAALCQSTLYPHDIATYAQNVRRKWDNNLRVLREHSEEFRKQHPAWVPPQIILKFVGIEHCGGIGSMCRQSAQSRRQWIDRFRQNWPYRVLPS